jgi:RNA polymerase sigma-70 factor (ECF subfamily)
VLKPDVSADLVDRVRRGEAEAYAGLVRAYLRPAYAVALSVVGRPADAEDIAQDAFLKAFAAIDTCHAPEHFGAWLFQIVRNRARNFLESRGLREVVTDGRRVLEIVLMPPESAGMREALLSALADLEVEDRQVVLLHDLERWTHAEIAQALAISEVHSRQRLFRARRAMRVKLDGQGSPHKNEGNHEG